MQRVDRLDTTHAQVLLVDMQARMMPAIDQAAEITTAAVRMLRAARALKVPITISEHYPSGLGATVPEVLKAAETEPQVEKMTFSVCGDDAARELLKRALRPAVLLMGVETHVCVQQTALDLLEMQMMPFVLADAVSSRRAFDRQVALDRLRAAGAVVTTTESAIFDLLRVAGTPQFKEVLALVK